MRSAHLAAIALICAAAPSEAAQTTYVLAYDRIVGPTGTATATAVIDDALFINGGVPARLAFNSADGLEALADFQLSVSDTGLIDGDYSLDNLTVTLMFDAPLDPTRELLAQDTHVGPGTDFALNVFDDGLLDAVDVSTFGAELRDPGDGSLIAAVRFRLVSMTPVATSADADADGVADANDNCSEIANADQIDSDADGYGNHCDADFNQDCIVNAQDLGIMRANFFGTAALTDLDGDGTTNATDLGLLKSRFFAAPGPSATGAACD